MGEIIVVSINKGGVGKTSLISNLSGAVAKDMKKRILLVDTDGQGNLSLVFGKNQNEYENTLYDVLTGNCDAKDAIVKLDYGMELLPANGDMNFWEFEVLKNWTDYTDPFKLLKDVLEPLRDSYDYIFIDTPPSIGLITGNALVASDKVLIPFVPETLVVNGLLRIIENIEDFKERYNPSLTIMGVVGMMVRGNTVLHSDLLPKARQYCASKNIKLFDTVITDSIRFANATENDGIPAVWTASKDKIVMNYYELMKEMFEHVKQH